MIVVYGTTLRGRVDEIPGLCYVATRFLHLMWVPLIPLGSHIVVGETDKGWRCVPCGLNLRSVLAGYLRGWLIGGGLWAILLGIFLQVIGDLGITTGLLFQRLLWIGVLPVAAGLLTLALWRHPSEKQFLEICLQLGISPETLLSAAQEPGAPDEMEPDEMAPGEPGRTTAPPALGEPLEVSRESDENVYAQNSRL